MGLGFGGLMMTRRIRGEWGSVGGSSSSLVVVGIGYRWMYM